MDNTLIKIKEIKTVKGPKNILISSVAFKMKNSYKDSSIYTDGLLEQLKFLDSSNKKFTYRLYFDQSIEKDKNWKVVLKEMKKRSYTELFKYECEILKDGDYHDGVFGTFMRFLPLFTENKNNKEWEVFMSTDVDFKIDNVCFEQMEKFKNSDEKFFIKLPKCYHLKSWISHLEMPKKYSLVVLGGSFASKITFNKKLLLDFLINIIEEGKYFKNFIKYNDLASPSFLKNKEHDKFIYGMDEYFLIDVLLKDIRKRDIPILIYNWYIHYTGLLIQIKNLNNNFKDLNNEEINRWKKLLKTVLRRGYDDKKSLNRNYSKLQYFGFCHENNFNMMICRNLAKEMRIIFAKNKQHLYGIPNDMRNCFNMKNYQTYYVLKLKNKK